MLATGCSELRARNYIFKTMNRKTGRK